MTGAESFTDIIRAALNVPDPTPPAQEPASRLPAPNRAQGGSGNPTLALNPADQFVNALLGQMGGTKGDGARGANPAAAGQQAGWQHL